MNYAKIASINGVGLGWGQNTYSYEDIQFTNAAFYRLRQVDIDGKATYSKVLYVQSKKTNKGKYSIFPNPLVNNTQFFIKGISATEINNRNI